MGKVCAFTGHRPQSLPFRFNESDVRCINLKKELKRLIEYVITAEGVTHFISGMAIGIDTFASEIILELKTKYPEITLEGAIPCEEQSAKWSFAQKERYQRIIEQLDKKTVIEPHYTPWCMHKRNRYMIDSSDVLIAVWDGVSGGTGKTVKYAFSKNITIYNINPNTVK